jgi:hypothetical protein
MKKILSNITIAAMVVLALCACNKDDDGVNSDATPVIRYVRPTAAEAADSLLTKGFMGNTVAIIGDNLAGVCEVWFNDQQATSLNPTMVADHAVIVTIPTEMYEEQNDLIRVVTRKGKETTHPFVTMPPPPAPRLLSPEYAMPGTEVTITGAYFYGETGDIKVYFPGNAEAEVVSHTATEIVVTVPDIGPTASGQLTVESPFGATRSTFRFRDNSGMFIDAEGDAWNNWNLSAFDSENGCSGTYIKFAGSTGSWAWPANSLQLFYVNPSQQPLVTTGNVSDYALRFEIKVTEWHDTPLLMWFDNDGNHGVDDAWAQYHWKPYVVNGAKTDFTTNGKWITVTVPLTNFNTDKEEKAERKIKTLDELVNFSMMWFGAADGEYSLDVRMDNFRIISIK